ncbi:MAG: dTDP-4-dehydrorhamnose reductase, partial [Pseudobutyrivibrio sp.]|nr:dTDP-4-dehydrorhamnose reductase [Pseudobutyrivibrio sp.]
MKFFVTGVNGQLGHDVMNELHKRGYEGVGSDIAGVYAGIADCSAVTKMPYVSLDITDKEAVNRVISEIRPDVVIHCAAWTAVDMAEDDDKVEKVRAVNAGGTRNIAEACKALDCKMLYLSTDYVFDGQGTEPWQPDCKDYKPLNVYGQTKLEGELVVSETLEKYFIVRIAWVFGLNGNNFIKTMINVGKTHDEVKVVNDQIGTPTYCFDLARLLVDMCETEKYGYYHATNEGGFISWYDF